jgi:uncharacterized coiled-coil protein SlyX
MAKTPEQFLREIVSEQIFQIAQLASQVDKLTEEVQRLTPKKKKEKSDGSKQDV